MSDPEAPPVEETPEPQQHPGSTPLEPGTEPEEIDSGLKYPTPGSPMDPTNPVADYTVPPDPKQPGGITAPLTVEEAIAAPPKSEAEKAAEVPPAEEPPTQPPV